MSLGQRVDAPYIGQNGAIFVIRTDLSAGSYTYGTGADTQTFSNNTWHHLAGTFDGRYVKQYFDGVLKGTVDLGGTYTIQYPTTFSTFFGDECGGTSAAGTHNFDGIINEVIVYNKALDAADLLKLAATDANGGPLPPDPYGVSYATSGVSSSNIGGYWRNDGSAVWIDRSGNGNDGVVSGSPSVLLFKQGINGSASTSTGRDGQGFPLKYQNNGAIGFNGSSNYIQISSDLLGTGNVSISAWVKAAGYGGSGYGRIVTNGKCVFYYSTNNSGQFVLQRDNSTMAATPTGSWPTANHGKWVHVVVTSTSAGSTNFYINGAFIGVADHTAGTPVAGGDVFIGNRSDGARGWDGQIANTQMYNRVLSSAEIQQNYKAQRSRFI